MALEPVDPLAEIIIQPVDRVLLHRGGGFQGGISPNEIPQQLFDLRVVGEHLRHDIRGPRQGVLHGLHTLFGVNILRRQLLRRGAAVLLGEKPQGQRLQPLFLGHGGPGAALLLVRAVQVLQGGQGGGIVDGFTQLLRHFPLLLDGLFHRLPPLLQRAQILQPLRQGAQGSVVHGAVQLLAVAGNKGDGVALVKQLDHIVYMALFPVQLPGENLIYTFQNIAPSIAATLYHNRGAMANAYFLNDVQLILDNVFRR